ncbi:unnamed protein product, partial [Polarella glacialis]
VPSSTSAPDLVNTSLDWADVNSDAEGFEAASLFEKSLSSATGIGRNRPRSRTNSDFLLRNPAPDLLLRGRSAPPSGRGRGSAPDSPGEAFASAVSTSSAAGTTRLSDGAAAAAARGGRPSGLPRAGDPMLLAAHYPKGALGE